MTFTRWIAVAACAAVASSALGHVFWVQPSTFRPSASEMVRLQFRVGDTFPGDALPRDESRVVSFVAAVPGMENLQPIAGRDGRDPAGLMRLARPGVYVVGYQSTPSSITLEAPKFEAYLKEEGLEKIIKARAERGESEQPARENYARCAKTILLSGEGEANVKDGTAPPASVSHAGFDRPLNLRFEIIPLNDPTALKAGEQLRVRALFEGKPLAGALVAARSPVENSPVLKARTDDKGEAALTVANAGMWVLNAVEMVRAPKDSGADWESVWASLTFEVKGEGAGPSKDKAKSAEKAPRDDANPTRAEGTPAPTEKKP